MPKEEEESLVDANVYCGRSTPTTNQVAALACPFTSADPNCLSKLENS